MSRDPGLEIETRAATLLKCAQQALESAVAYGGGWAVAGLLRQQRGHCL